MCLSRGDSVLTDWYLFTLMQTFTSTTIHYVTGAVTMYPQLHVYILSSKLTEDESHLDTSGSFKEMSLPPNCNMQNFHIMPGNPSNVPLTGCECTSQSRLTVKETGGGFRHELWRNWTPSVRLWNTEIISSPFKEESLKAVTPNHMYLSPRGCCCTLQGGKIVE